MSVPPELPHQDTQVDIDTEIVLLEQVIRDAHAKILDLRTRRNTAVPPISRLPAETLAEIFVLFESQYREESFAPQKQAAQTRPFGWLAITHVCRYWRIVARSLPHLWSHIPMSPSEKPIKMFLGLSKGVPLSILPGKQSYDHQQPPGLLSLLVPEAPRIRSLHMCISAALLEDLDPKLWNAPQLESITLGLVDDCPPEGDAPASVWDAALPALRSLSMTAFSCTFARGFFRPTLTKLVVAHPDVALSVAEWVDVLSELPLLEHLTLQGALPQGSVPAEPIVERIEMHHLAHVELFDWDIGMQCAHLFAHLHLPACRALALSLRGDGPRTPSEFHALFSAVSSALGDAFAPQSASLYLGHTALSTRLWRAAPPLSAWKHAWGYDTRELREPSERPAVALDIDALGAPLPPALLRPLVAGLPLHALRLLRIWDWDGECARSVRPLAALHALEALLYVCARPLGLLRALAEPATPPPLPALRHLALRHAKWHAHGGRCCVPYGDPPLAADVDAVVAARARMGVPLDELYLQGLRHVDEARDLAWFDAPRASVWRFVWDKDQWGCYRPLVPCVDCVQGATLGVEEVGGDAEGELDSDFEFTDVELSDVE